MSAAFEFRMEKHVKAANGSSHGNDLILYDIGKREQTRELFKP